jgi:hypothetical protein
MPWQIEKRIYLRHGDLFRTIGNLDDVVSGPNLSFFYDAEVEPWSMVRNK